MPDKANVVVLPPVIFVVALLLGLLIDFVVPIQVLPRTPALWLGALFILISIPIVVSAMRELDKAKTAIDVRKPTSALVRTGAFQFSRNPIYVAMVMLYLGIASLINSLWICLLVVPAVTILQLGVIRREEGYLEQKFGEDYRRYKAQVHRWL
ncbi:MAG: isoprenylcysteine carboxylmethyltransferase family protein [Nitrospira sp.]|nr:isoprenylcysteine carboxylmethyltransferase family protein [Nitrospira sp.]